MSGSRGMVLIPKVRMGKAKQKIHITAQRRQTKQKRPKTWESIILSGRLLCFGVPWGMQQSLFLCEGFWRWLESGLTLKKPRGTWVRDEWGLLDHCLSSHTSLCYSLFVCHPIKHAQRYLIPAHWPSERASANLTSLSKQRCIGILSSKNEIEGSLNKMS